MSNKGEIIPSPTHERVPIYPAPPVRHRPDPIDVMVTRDTRITIRFELDHGLSDFLAILLLPSIVALALLLSVAVTYTQPSKNVSTELIQ